MALPALKILVKLALIIELGGKAAIRRLPRLPALVDKPSLLNLETGKTAGVEAATIQLLRRRFLANYADQGEYFS